MLHEIAHMLWGHELLPDTASLTGLFPDLDPRTVLDALSLHRTGYAERQEQQAEMTASLLGQAIDRLQAPRGLSGSLGRLQDALGGSDEPPDDHRERR
ncbi:hypothetical protein FFZ77_30920 [Streptomyces katsurahamanus]|uniref:IrrE N-terminal-like domain-containing protein n=1 Tax=Streptomyces katsurahamanus TaxID=2577098 RepID=A0ABW9P2M1_9ACTN|nr:hypothetical protein [Streptomyces katsurahamanus]